MTTKPILATHPDFLQVHAEELATARALNHNAGCINGVLVTGNAVSVSYGVRGRKNDRGTVTGWQLESVTNPAIKGSGYHDWLCPVVKLLDGKEIRPPAMACKKL